MKNRKQRDFLAAYGKSNNTKNIRDFKGELTFRPRQEPIS
jgi:hypothetical protein